MVNRSLAHGGSVHQPIHQYASLEGNQNGSAAATIELRSKTRQEKSMGANLRKNMNNRVKNDLSQDVIMRAKLGPGSRSPDMNDNLSVPSDISSDMWGEVPKYQAYKLEQ